MDEELFILKLPFTPPSFNAVGHSGSRWKWTKEKKSWQQFIEVALMQKTLPRRTFGHISANALLSFTTKRRRDEGNYRVLLEKCLGDALVNGLWLPDDTAEQYQFWAVEMGLGPKPETRLYLHCN